MEITRETVLSEILENCALASGENLEQACSAHGVDPDEFIEGLKNYLATL